MLRLIPLLAALCIASTAFATPGTRVGGRVYYDKLDAKLPSFIFHGDVTDTDGKTIAVSTYLDTAGKPLIVEECEIVNNRLVKYAYKQNQVNESGSAVVKDDKMVMTFTDESGTETDSEANDPMLVVAPMIGPLITRKWNELMQGDSIKVRYMAIERLETIGFKFFKDNERTLNGKAVIDIKMKPSSFIIAALVDPIIITVDKEAPHRIIETNGRLPVRVAIQQPPKKRRDWRAIDARVEYDLPKPLDPAASR